MKQHFHLATRPARQLFLLVFAVFLQPLGVFAQSTPAQYKTQSISIFGGYLYDRVSYTPGAANGGTLGIDLNQHFRSRVTLSLEGRATGAWGYYVNQHSETIGIRGEYRLGRLHPYGTFNFGLGTMHFNPPQKEDYIGDKSAVFAGGAGVEYELDHGLRAKIDYELQRWDIDPFSHEVFKPSLVTIGVAYVIPFRPYHRHNDPHR